MGKPFTEEIDRLHATSRWVFDQDVDQLRRLLYRWTDGPLIVVGSGGSYSAAVAWASFHRKSTGEPCFPSTPFGLAELISSLKQCRVMLLSAEGKNNDILNAAKLAQSEDVPCAALTFTVENPLTNFSESERSLYTFSYPMDWSKDGYLATNTLFAMVLLAARVYFQPSIEEISPLVDITAINARRDALKAIPQLTDVHDAGALILFGPGTTLLAVDLESKLTESALAKCEVTDFRQFSHGRHLQLAQPLPRLPVVFLVYTENERDLAQAMTAQFPDHIVRVEILVPTLSIFSAALNCLVEAFLIVEAIAQSVGVDPGQPEVPNFGRAIYSIDSASLTPTLKLIGMRDIAVKRKLNTAIATREHSALIEASADLYLKKLESARFKAIICDFDGTLCHAHQRFEGMDTKVQARILALLESGFCLGIATGRGKNIAKTFRESFPQRFWDQIWLGLYSGSVIARLSEEIIVPNCSSELLSVIEWLESSVLKEYAFAAREHCKAGQLSLRLGDHSLAERVKSTLSGWILETGKSGWRVFSSGHSVDLLVASTTKVSVIKKMVTDLELSSELEILLIGDAGQAGGNDFEMLQNRHSLSADRVSDSLTCCWNFAPPGVRQADATNFYLSALSMNDGWGRLNLTSAKF